jgi:hypothetical protein
MRHVPFATSLTTRAAPFAAAAQPALRETWNEYWTCKADPACRPTLCGPRHISDPRWLASNLSRRAVADAGGAQWAPPAWDAEAAAVGVGDAVESVALRALEAAAAAGGDDPAGGAAAAAPLLEAYRACAPGKGVRSHRGLSSLLGCARSSWMKNVTEFLTAARNKARGGRG